MLDLKQILANWAETVVETAQRNLGATQNVVERGSYGQRTRKRRRVASGNLKRSLTFFIRKGSGNTKIVFTAKGSAKDYADVIEKGRRPNSKPPPIEPIVRWMRGKGVDDKKISGAKQVRLRKPGGGFAKGGEDAIRSAAYLIARKIGKYGITGIHYYEEAVEQNLPELKVEVEKYVEYQLNNDGN